VAFIGDENVGCAPANPGTDGVAHAKLPRLLHWRGRARHDLVCADEDPAMEQAKSLVDGQSIELSEAARKIATFDPEQ
jgi:hypothetical protein